MSDNAQLQAALHQLSRGLGPQHPVVSAAQLDLSEALLSGASAKLDEAETLLLRARDALAVSCGEQHPTTARCLPWRSCSLSLARSFTLPRARARY